MSRIKSLSLIFVVTLTLFIHESLAGERSTTEEFQNEKTTPKMQHHHPPTTTTEMWGEPSAEETTTHHREIPSTTELKDSFPTKEFPEIHISYGPKQTTEAPTIEAEVVVIRKNFVNNMKKAFGVFAAGIAKSVAANMLSKGRIVSGALSPSSSVSAGHGHHISPIFHHDGDFHGLHDDKDSQHHDDDDDKSINDDDKSIADDDKNIDDDDKSIYHDDDDDDDFDDHHKDNRHNNDVDGRTNDNDDDDDKQGEDGDDGDRKKRSIEKEMGKENEIARSAQDGSADKPRRPKPSNRQIHIGIGGAPFYYGPPGYYDYGYY